MPTYQSSPFYPIIFPDQAVKENMFGVQPLSGNLLQHLPLEKSQHPSWKKEADERAMAKVSNTKLSELSMLKGPISIKGQIAYTTYRGPHDEAFKHSFSGGTVWTREAEDMIGHLRKDRIEQLNALDQATFEQVAPERLQTVIPEADTFLLDQSFSSLLTSLSEGLISPTLLGFSNSIISYFLTKADKIPEHKFAHYKDVLGKIASVINGAYYKDRREGLYSKGDYKKIDGVLNKLTKDVRGIIKFIEDYSSYFGSPTKTKSAKLAAIRNKLFDLAQQNAQQSVEAAEVLHADYVAQAEQQGLVPQNADDWSGDSSTYVPSSPGAAGEQYAPLLGSETDSNYSMPSGNTGLPIFEVGRFDPRVRALSQGSSLRRMRRY